MTGSPSTLRAVFAAVRLQWRAAPIGSVILSAFAITGALLGTTIAWLTKLLLDELAGARAPDRLTWLAILIAAAGGIAELALVASRYIGLRVNHAISMHVDRELFAKVIEHDGVGPLEDPEFHARLRLAEESSHGAPQQLAGLVQSLLRAAFSIGSLLAFVVAVWPPMAALTLLVGGVGIAANVLRSRTDAAELPDLANRHLWRDHYRRLIVDLRAAKEIRLFGIGSFLLEHMLAAGHASNELERARERRSLRLQLAMSAATALVGALGLVVVVRGEVAGQLAVGDIALFIAATAGIQAALTGVIGQLGYAGVLVRMFVNYLRVVEAPGPPKGRRTELPPLRDAIELRDVWFRYDEQGPWVLRGVDLRIPRGAAFGLVGLNGAGKSTLIKLLARYYEPTRGQILWDGIDLQDLEPSALRRRLSATFQDFMTYELSAADNIALGDLAHRDDLAKIREAASAVGIDRRLSALPNGYATRLSRSLADPVTDASRGATLSGGEWQRVALARAFMRDFADVWILDEPNAGLDADAELEIHTAIAHRAADRTRVLVSHRLNTLRHASTIAILEGGRIVEQGTHDELMRARGEYARLFALQAAGYQDHRVTALVG